jgi:cell division septal protein FtsQ
LAKRRLSSGWIGARWSRSLALVLGASLILIVLWQAAPPLLRRLEFFRIRRVEIAGLQYLAPARVIAELELHQKSSVFDDLPVGGGGIGSLPGIRSVEIKRRLPGTLEIMVEEAAPVALAPRARGMALLDSSGQVLPFDPAAAAPDLPIARSADRIVARVLARVQEHAPLLFGQIDAAWRAGNDVVLDWDRRRVWLGPAVTAEDIRAVVAVAQDLARQGRNYLELDGRFAGQVIVRRARA